MICMDRVRHDTTQPARAGFWAYSSRASATSARARAGTRPGSENRAGRPSGLGLAVLGLLLVALGVAPPLASANQPEAGYPHIEVTRQGTDGLSLEITIPEVSLEQVEAAGQTFQVATIPGGSLQGETGSPALPVYSRLVAVPFDAGAWVTAVIEEQEEIPSVRLLPMQEDEGSAFAYDAAAYARDGYGEAAPVTSGGPAICRNLRLIPITVQPVAYNPARQTLRVARRMQVEVSYTGGSSENVKVMEQKSVPPSFDALYRDLVINYDPPAPGERLESGTWLIICANDNSVISLLQPLVDWRKRMGLPVRLATTAETGTSNTQIKAFIQNAYDTWAQPPEFVVLAGDASGNYAIPTWRENLSGYNGEGDHPYSQLEGNDLLADAHIGRLSFEDLNTLQVVVTKIVGYESTPILSDPGYYGRACLVGDPSPSGQSCIGLMQWVKTRLRQLGYAQIDTVFSSPFVSRMSTALNQGDTIFAYRGYIGMSGWGSSNTNSLQNGWKLHFGVMSTCGTGSFASGTSASEAFLRAGSVGPPFVPKAAIGAVGTATSGTHTRFNNAITFGIFQGLLYDGTTQLGAAFSRGKAELFIEYGQTQINWATIFSYWNNLMGDPATDCWTAFPEPVVVTHPLSLATGANTVPVMVRQWGAPLAGARVCLWKGSETWVVGETDAHGMCELPITQATAGDLLLTVTRHNSQPYLATLPVSDQPVFVTQQAFTLDDDNSGESQGNGNGAANPTETIELRVQLRNFGTQTAPGVSATLSSTDPYVQVIDGVETYGNMAGGAAVWSPDDFDFTISSACPHDHFLRFSLDITSGSQQWHSLLQVKVTAADLVAQSYALTGAGGNGTLDPGETVGLNVTLRNAGGMNASGVLGTLVSNSPFVLVQDASGSFGNIAAGGTGTNISNPFSISADPSAFPGHLASLTILESYNSGLTDTTEIVVPVGTRVAQDPIGPDRYGYYAFDNVDVNYSDCPTYNWVEIDPAYGGSGTEIVLGDEGDYQDKSRTVNLPFTFQFYGTPFNEVTVCSNGWIAMGQTYLTEYRNWSIPGAGAPNNMLAVFWDDLVQQGGKVLQWHDAANHRYIVEWSRMRNIVGGSLEVFEAILYDPAHYPSPSGDGIIVFQYHTVNNVDGTDGYATVGIQNFDHTDGLLYTYFAINAPGAAGLAAGRAIKFVPATASPMGILRGMVSNETFGDTPMPGVDVRILQLDRVFRTGDDGRYQGNTAQGVYTVVASLAGFEPDTALGVVITASEITTQDFELRDIQGPSIENVTQIGTTPDPVGPYIIEATVADLSTVEAVSLFHRVNLGAWVEAAMEKVGESLFRVALPGVPSGCQIDYYVQATDGAGLVATAPAGAPEAFYTFYITELFYSYAAEDPTEPAWTLGVPGDNATSGIWVREDPVGTEYNGVTCQPEDDRTPSPGTRCFVTGNGSPGGAAGDQDVDGGCTTLLSPNFDLSGTSQAYIVYWRWFGEMGLSADDEFAIDVSSDGGGSWTALERLPDNANAWTEVRLDLSAFIDLTDQVAFRFVACDLNSGGLIEAAIDDIAIETFTLNTSATPDRVEAVFREARNQPNPFAGSTFIHFSIAQPGTSRLAIYDIQGRLVRRLLDSPLSAGSHAIAWDGRAADGAVAPSGIYFYRLETPGHLQIRKILKVD